MAAPTRFRPTAPESPLERAVLVLLYVVVLLPVIGVLMMLAAGGTVFGFTIGNLGEMPWWMAVWLFAGAILFVLVAAWGIHFLAGWLSRGRV